MVSPDTMGTLTPSPSAATSIQSSEIAAQCLPDHGAPQAGLSSARATSQPPIAGADPRPRAQPEIAAAPKSDSALAQRAAESPQQSAEAASAMTPAAADPHLTHWHWPPKQPLTKCMAKYLAQTVRHLGPRLGQLYWPHQHSRAARYESGSYCSFRKS